jgi:hypothetical protein
VAIVVGTGLRGNISNNVSKEHSMASRRICVVVRAWGCHKLHVFIEELRWIELLVLGNGPHQKPGKLAFKGILTSLQADMIVKVEPSPPILLLSMIYDCTDDLSFVTATAAASSVTQIHDAALHVILGLGEPSDLPVVFLQVTKTVVPVDGHGKSIANKQAKEAPLLAFRECQDCCRG